MEARINGPATEEARAAAGGAASSDEMEVDERLSADERHPATAMVDALSAVAEAAGGAEMAVENTAGVAQGVRPGACVDVGLEIAN